MCVIDTRRRRARRVVGRVGDAELEKLWKCLQLVLYRIEGRRVVAGGNVVCNYTVITLLWDASRPAETVRGIVFFPMSVILIGKNTSRDGRRRADGENVTVWRGALYGVGDCRRRWGM